MKKALFLLLLAVNAFGQVKVNAIGAAKDELEAQAPALIGQKFKTKFDIIQKIGIVLKYNILINFVDGTPVYHLDGFESTDPDCIWDVIIRQFKEPYRRFTKGIPVEIKEIELNQDHATVKILFLNREGVVFLMFKEKRSMQDKFLTYTWVEFSEQFRAAFE